MRTVLIAHATFTQIGSVLALLAALGVAWRSPPLGDRYARKIESLGARLAERKGLAIATIAAATVLIRLSLLWLLPVPAQKIQDEFSYLLAADTFAHGRLTNPTHPLWRFFDTIHVNQRPTYMSKYPPAQGAAPALGQLLGHPWIGVVLSAAAMCAATLWMLQGWLPPRWALAGGTLLWLRLGNFLLLDDNKPRRSRTGSSPRSPAIRCCRRRRSSSRATLRIDDEEFVILLIGNDWKKKGLPCLLAAAARLADCRLQILVVGQDTLPPYQDMIHSLGLDGRVTFLPLRSDVEFYYAAADVYAGPSLEDAFALPPAEAMACGLPTITTRMAGASEIITRGEDGLILEDPTDAQTLSEWLQRLSKDPDWRNRMGEAASRTAAKYTWARNASEMRVVFDRAIAHNSQRAQ